MTDLVTLAAALCAGEDVTAIEDEEAPPKRGRARSGRVAMADVKLARAHGAPTTGCQDVARAHAEARRRAGRGEALAAPSFAAGATVPRDGAYRLAKPCSTVPNLNDLNHGRAPGAQHTNGAIMDNPQNIPACCIPSEGAGAAERAYCAYVAGLYNPLSGEWSGGGAPPRRWAELLHRDQMCWRDAVDAAFRAPNAPTIRPGDIVVLRSGGPELTVLAEGPAGLTVSWFSVSAEARCASFPAAALRVVRRA